MNSLPSGISRGTRAIIHRTVRCTPDSVRCAKEELPQELASFGKLQRLVHYNSPDCPVCTGLSGATPEQRLTRANGYLQSIYCALCARRRQACPYWHTGQQTVHVRCAPDTQAGPQVRSSNGQNPTAVMTWQGHRTVRCAPDTFGGWGYKYPNHPTIHCIQVFHFPTTTRALAFNSRHTKEIKSSPNSTQHHSD
jgi:hypothetical protein